MKRAIFKMGKECLISTQNGDRTYDVDIKPAWTADENDWQIPVRPSKKTMPQDGTTIVIGNLHPGIAERFGSDAKSFTTDLDRMVATHYAYIIDRGFEVRINHSVVKPRPTRLIFDTNVRGANKEAIQPFMFKMRTKEGIEVFIAVGFTRPIPSQDEIVTEQEEKKYSSLDAGWTVLCNDRAVLYCDRSELTGWGEAGVPRYHTQFTAISGIVEFRAADASKLPTTTTKRGIDTSSTLYLQVKNKMREGMSLFTDYTNKWKGRAEESRKQIEAAGPPIAFEELKAASARLPFTATKRTIPAGDQYKPKLPLPKKIDTGKRRISFVKPTEDVQAISQYLFDEPDRAASTVGEKCFDLVLKEARK